MAQQTINIGTGNNTGDGEGLRPAFDKCNDNFNELYLQSGHASYAEDGYNTSGTAFTVLANTDTVLPNNGINIYDSQKPNDITSFYFSGGLDLSAQTGDFINGEAITGGTSSNSAIIYEQSTNKIEYLKNISEFTIGETITGVTSGATATIDDIRDGYITGRNNDNLDIMIYFKAEPTNATQWLDIWIDIGGSIGELYRQTFNFPKGIGVERGVLYALPSAYTRDTWEANGGIVYIRSNDDIDIFDINFNFDISYRAR